MSCNGAIAFCFSLSVHPSLAAKENFSNKNSSRLKTFFKTFLLGKFPRLWGKPRTLKGLETKPHLSFPGFHLHSIQDGESRQNRAESRDLRVTLPQMRKTIFLECRQVVCANLRSQEGLSKEI